MCIKWGRGRTVIMPFRLAVIPAATLFTHPTPRRVIVALHELIYYCKIL